MTSPQVHVAADPDALAADVAGRTVAVLRTAQATRGSAALVLTGGSILERSMAALAEHGADLDWSRVDVYWGDERFVPADSADRNELPARSALLDRLPFDPARIHPMPPSDGADGDDVDASADAYQARLGTDLDVALIGIGPDGHCCSLFPDQPGPLVTDRLVIAVRDSPKPPPTRLSLTFPALARIAQVFVIAAGAEKADAAASALSGADPAHVPSAGARGRDATWWLLDEAAAARLPEHLA